MKKFVRGRLGRGLSLLVMVIMMLPGLLTPFTQRANADDSWGKKVFILPFQVTAPNPPDSMGRDILNELCVDLQSQMNVSVIPLERDSIFLAIAYQQHDMLDKAAKATLLEKIHNEYAKRLKEYKNDEDRALLMACYDVAADPNSEVTNRDAAISYLAQLLKADSFIYGTVDTYEFSDTDGAQAKIHLSATQVKFDSNYNALPAAPINVIGKSVVRPDGSGTREMHNAEAVRNIGERLALLLTGKALPTDEEVVNGDGVNVTSAPAPKRGGSSFNKILPYLGAAALAAIIYSATRGGGKSATPPPPPGTGQGYAYPYPDGSIRLLFTVTPAQWAAAQTFEVYRANQGTRVRAVGVPDAGPFTKAQVNYNSATGVVTIIDRPAANGLFNYQVKMINTDLSFTTFSMFNGTTLNPTVAQNPLVGPYMPPAATGLQVTNEVGGIVNIAWTYPAGSQAGLINRIQILARNGSVWSEINPLLPVASSATTAKIALAGTTDIQVIPLGVGNYKSATLNPEILTVTINPTSLTPASNVQAVLAPLPNWTKVNINVTWTPSPDPLVTGYKIYRNTTNTKAMGDAALSQTGLHPSHAYNSFDTRTDGILVPNRSAAGVRSPAGSTLVQDNIAVTTSRFVDSDIHDGTKYTYTVEAVRTGTSLVADATSNDIWVDAPPANPSAVTATPNPGQVVVGWTAPTTNADGSPISMMVGGGFNVYRLNAAPANPLGYTRAELLAGKKINTNLIPFGTNTISDTTVVNRTKYFYTLEVIDGATPAQSSFGPYSYNSATPMPAVSQLTVTSPNLTLTAGATNVPITVTVSGSDGLGLANYQVSMSTPGVGLGSITPTLPATATSNASGNASFVYTAPMPVDVTTQKTVTLTATAVGVLPALTKTITFTINPLAPVAVQLYADNNSVRALGLTALTARIVDVSGISIPNQPVTIACTDQTCSYLDPVTSTYKLFTTPFSGVTSSAGDLRLNIKAGPNTGTATFTATSGTLFSAIANIDILGIPSAVSINLPAQISAVTTGTVTVTDSNSTPVSGVVVHLSTNRGSITPSVFTNAQGQGNFTLTPGTTNTTATVTALLDGGITATTTVTFVTIENPLLVSGGTKIDAHDVHVIVGQATPFIWQLYGADGLPLASKSVVVKVTNGTIGAGSGNVQSFATSTTSDGQVTFTYNSPITNGSTVLSFTDAANKKIGSDILLKAVLAAPTGLALVPKSDKEIDLTWQNSVGNYGYEIQRAQENNNPLTPLAWTTIFTTTQNTTTYNDTRVPQSGTTYFYQLRALAPAGQVDFNSDFTAALQASTFPKKPLLHVPGVNDITNDSVKLTWEGTADNFGIYSSPDNVVWSLVQTAPGNNDIAVLNTSVVSVVPSSKQYFRIIANSGGVPSVPSDPVYVITLPPAPTGLALTVISSSQINLVWNAVAGASSYSISRKTAAEINYTVIAPSLNSSTLSYSDTGLQAGTTYFYKVGDSIGSSAPSYGNPVSAMTELQTPTNVMIDASVPITDSTVNITWTGVTGADGYQIYTSPTGLSTSTWTINTIISHVGLPTSTQKGQLTGLQGSTTYFIMVVASSNATGNNSTGSWPIMVKTLPAAPTGLTVTATSDTALKLDVTVDPLVGFYELERSSTINFATVERAWSAVGTEFPYSDTGLLAAHTYYYHVRSVTGGITSSWSVAKSGTTQPSAPVLLSAVPTDVTVALSWTGNGDSYNVESSPTGVTWTLLSTVPAVAGPAQSAVVASAASTTTFYRIIATANGIVSAPSNSLGVTTLPVAPAGLTVTPVSAVTLKLGITVDPTITLYEVERSKSLATAANGTYSTPDGSMIDLSGSQFPYNDTGLTAATVYYYHIRSTKAGIKSAWSNSVSGTTGLVTPIGVTVKVIASTDTTLELNWKGVTGADYYTVSRTGLATPVTVPHVGAANATQVYTFTGLTAATSYDFTVIANSSAGSSSAASLPATGNTLPAAPVGMIVTAVNASTLKLAVTVDPLVTLYEVERSLLFATKADGSFTTPAGAMLNLIGTQFPYSDTGLTAATLYYYHIRGSKAGVKSAWSPLVSGTTNLATPTGISINTVASSDTTLDLTWTGVTGADYYTVTRTGLATPVIIPHVGTPNALQRFTFTGLTAASSYDFTIVANSSGGLISAASLPVTGTTLPGALTGLTVTSINAVTLKLGITIDPAVTLYEIERSKSLATNANGTFATPDGLTLNLTGSQFPYTDTGLTAATIYYYHVRGTKAGVKTAWSTIATGITLPAAPVLVSATPADISVTLTWTGLGDFYNVESSPNGTTWTQIATIPTGVGPSRTATVPSVADTTTFYRIIVSANSVLSAPSNVLAAQTLPAAPAGLTVTSLNATSLKLGITVDPTITLYEIERSLSIATNANGAFTTPVGTTLNLIGSQFPYTDAGLTSATIYYYHVRGTKAGVKSAWSTLVSGITGLTTPTGLTVNTLASTETTLELKWTGVTGADYYTVTRVNPAATVTVLHIGAPGATQVFTFTGLTAFTSYDFTVAANSNGGSVSAASLPATGKTLAVAPAAPAGLTVTSVNASTLKLGVIVDPLVTLYEVERSKSLATNVDGSFTTQDGSTLNLIGGQFPYSNTGLTAATLYYYHIRGTKDGVKSAWSTLASGTTGLTTPTGLAVVSVASTDSTLDISWTGAVGADYYTVTRTGLATPVTVPHVGAPGATQTYTFTGLTAATSYDFTVAANSISGALSATSTPVTGKTLPDAPTGLTVTATNATTLKIGVTVDPAVTLYEVERSRSLATNANGSFTTPSGAMLSLIGTQFPYSDTILTSATLYYYHIRGTKAGVKSAWSPLVSATTNLTTPTGVTVNTIASTDTSLDLNWTGVAGADYYTVTRSNPSITVTVAHVGAPGATQTYTFTGLTTATSYDFTVVANSNEGAVSAASLVVTGKTLPTAPTGLTVTPINATTLRLGVTVDATVTFYEVERSLSAATNASGSFITPVGTTLSLIGTQFPYTDTGLTTATLYYYHVRGTKAGVKSAWSPLVSGTTNLTTPTGVTINTVASTDTSLELSWTGVAGADFYTLTSTGPTAKVTVAHVGAPGATQTYTFTGLTAATSYDFTVAANNTAGAISAASLVVTGKTLPAAPQGLTVTQVNATTLKLGVTLDPTVTLYEVERSKSLALNANGAFTTPVGTPLSLIGTQFPYSDTGLTSVTLYYYHIRGTKAGVMSAWSPLVSATTNIKTPTGVTVNTVASTDITLSINWTGVTGADYYTVTRTGLATPVTVPHVGASGSTQTYTFTGLTAATSYDFTVAANTNDGAVSAASLPISGMTMPAAPAGLTVTATNATTLKIGVTVDATVTMYEVERSKSPATNADGTFTTIDGTLLSLIGSQFPYSDTGLTAATLYYYHIRGTKAGVKSAWSPLVSATTNLTTPTGVTVDTVASTDTTLDLKWTGVTGADFYTLTSTGPTAKVTVAHVGAPGATQTYTFTGLAAANSYDFTVAAANSISGAVSTASTPVTGKTLPAAPAGLTVTATNATTLKIVVTLDPAVTLYEVERSKSLATNANGTFTTPVGTITNLIGTQFPYSDTGLTSATLYYYHIRGTKAGVKSAWSPLVSATTNLTTPTGVTVNTIASTDTSLDLNWTGVAGADYYTVTRSNPAITVTVAHVGAPGATQTYTFTGLAAANSYDFTVVANSNEGAVSTASLLVSGKTLPAAPQGFVVTSISATTLKLAVTTDPATTYEIERSLAPAINANGTFTTPVGTGLSLISTQFPYTDSGLTAATLYYYHIRGSKAGVKSTWSPLVTGATLPTPPVLTSIVPTDVTVTLSWTGVGEFYIVERSTDGTTWTKLPQIVPAIAGPTQTTIDSPVSPSTAYLYRVIASANGVDSAPSNVLGTTTKPPTPTGLTVGTGVDDKSLIVNFTAVAGATSYDLVRSLVITTNPDGSFTTPVGASILLTPGDLPYTNIGLTGGTDYFYIVRTHIGASVSGWSTVKNGQTRPSTPKNLAVTAGAITATTIQLTWTGVLGAANYTLTNGATTITVPHVGAVTDTQTYKVTGLTPSTSYDFTVAAKSLTGVSSAASAPVTGITLAGSTIPVVAQFEVGHDPGTERIYYSQGPADQLSSSVLTYTDLTITGFDAGGAAAMGATITIGIRSGPGGIEVVSANETKIGNNIIGTLNNNGQMIIRYHGRTTNSAVPYTPLADELGMPEFAVESLGLPVPLQTQATPVTVIGPPAAVIVGPAGITTINSDQIATITATVYDRIGQVVPAGFPLHFTQTSNMKDPLSPLLAGPDDTLGDGLVRYPFRETDANGVVTSEFTSNHSGLYTIHAFGIKKSGIDNGVADQLLSGSVTGTSLVRARTYMSYNDPVISNMITGYPFPAAILNADGTDSCLVTITGKDDDGKLVLPGIPIKVKTTIGKIQLLNGKEFTRNVWAQDAQSLAFNNISKIYFYMRSDSALPTVGRADLSIHNMRVTANTLTLPEYLNYFSQSITLFAFKGRNSVTETNILSTNEPNTGAITLTTMKQLLVDEKGGDLPAGYKAQLWVDNAPYSPAYYWSGATRLWCQSKDSLGAGVAWDTNSPFTYSSNVVGPHTLNILITDPENLETNKVTPTTVRVTRAKTATVNVKQTNTSFDVKGTYNITAFAYDDDGIPVIPGAKIDFYVVEKAGTYDIGALRYLGTDLTKSMVVNGIYRNGVAFIDFTPDLTNYASVQVAAFVDRNGNSIMEPSELLGSSVNFSMINAPLNVRNDNTNKTNPLSDKSIPLIWDAVVGANRYDIYRDGGGLPFASSLTNTFVDSTLTQQATKYNYAVRAVNTNATYGATSALSNAVDIYTVPTKVTIASIGNITETSARIHLLAETTDPKATKYRVYDNQSFKVIEVAVGLPNGYIDVTGLSPGTTHSLSVRVVDTTLTPQQESLDSNIITINTLSIPAKLQLSVPAVTAINTTSVMLHWLLAPEPNVTDYKVYGGPGSPVSLGSTSVHDYTVSGLAPGTAYSFTITAVCAAGESPKSNAINATTQPGAVNQNGSTVSATAITFKWDALAGNPAVTGYNVYSNGLKVGTVATGTTLVVAGTYTAGTTYNLIVRAVAGALESADSNTIAASF